MGPQSDEQKASFRINGAHFQAQLQIFFEARLFGIKILLFNSTLTNIQYRTPDKVFIYWLVKEICCVFHLQQF